MINSLQTKVVNLTPPAAILNNGAFTVAALDTKGFDYVDIYVILGALDIALTVLKMTESDDNSSYADIPGSLYGGTGVPVLPLATDDNKIFAFHIQKTGARKRFFKPAVTMGNGATGGFVTVIAFMSRAKETPNSATTRGLGNEINL